MAIRSFFGDLFAANDGIEYEPSALSGRNYRAN
jgi:hypothetical protein